MTSDGNEHEMTEFRKLGDEEIDAILDGTAPIDADLRGIVEFVDRMRATGTAEIADTTASKHIAAASEAARLTQAPVHDRASRRYKWRRRTVFGSFITTILAKFLAASVALAAVAGGAGAVANQAAPGDPLYGIDQAFERVHLFDGGTVERLQEAQRMVAEDHVAAALEHAGDALARADRMRDQARDQERDLERAAEALRQAADAVGNDQAADAPGYAYTEQIREQVRNMLGTIADEMDEGRVDGQKVAETARHFREVARQMAEQRKQERFGPAPTRPPVEPPVVTPVEPKPIVVPAPGEPEPIPIPTTMPTDTDGMGTGGSYMGGDGSGGGGMGGDGGGMGGMNP